MKILHVYNNNVVMAALDDGPQAVVIGRGLAFLKKKGQAIDSALIEQTFLPETTHRQENLSALIPEIPSDVLALTTELEDYVLKSERQR